MPTSSLDGYHGERKAPLITLMYEEVATDVRNLPPGKYSLRREGDRLLTPPLVDKKDLPQRIKKLEETGFRGKVIVSGPFKYLGLGARR